MNPGPGELYQLALEAVRDLMDGTPEVHKGHGSITGAIKAVVVARGFTCSEPQAADLCWLLVLRRILAPTISSGSSLGAYFVTPWGRIVFGSGRPLPTDPDGYVNSVQGQLDREGLALAHETALYLREAAECFANGQYIAAVVMMGCVCESEIKLVGRALMPTGLATAAQEKDLADWRVSTCSAAVETMLDGCAQTGKLSKALADEHATHMKLCAGALMMHRNSAGHPTGRDFHREHVYGPMVWLIEAIVFFTRLRQEITTW